MEHKNEAFQIWIIKVRTYANFFSLTWTATLASSARKVEGRLISKAFVAFELKSSFLSFVGRGAEQELKE